MHPRRLAPDGGANPRLAEPFAVYIQARYDFPGDRDPDPDEAMDEALAKARAAEPDSADFDYMEPPEDEWEKGEPFTVGVLLRYDFTGDRDRDEAVEEAFKRAAPAEADSLDLKLIEPEDEENPRRARRELTEAEARRAIRRELLALDWTPGTVEQTLAALDKMDGPWSYGTDKMTRDLGRVFERLKRKHGEPPDREW